MNTDSDIIFLKIKKGEVTAYEELFRQNYSTLCRYANTFLNDSNISEDIVQDVFLKLWKERNKLNINRTVKGYLYAAVRNHSLNYIKSKSLHQSHQKQIFLKSDRLDNVNESLDYRDLKDIVKLTFQKLPYRTAEIFNMSRFEDLKYREIAEVMNISIKTVEVEMGRALKAFRTSLKNFRN